jgi:lipopolysaccharide export system protein LptA
MNKQGRFTRRSKRTIRVEEEEHFVMKRAPLFALAVLATLMSGSASAQLGKGGEGPLGINAEDFRYDPATCVTVWTGKVEASQDQMRLRADQLNVYGHKSGAKSCSGDFDRIEATGNVFYVTPEIKARGDKAVYLASNETVTITGRVVVSSEQGVTETNRLILNVNTNEARMGGDPGQRVRAVIYPGKKSAQKK